MENKTRFSLGRLFANKKFNICFSVIAAFVFWLIITIDQNPVREMTLSGIPIIVSVDGTATGDMGLGLTSDISPSEAVVVVSGPSYIVSSIKSDNITVTAELTEVNKPGSYELNLVASKNGIRSGVDIVSVFPKTVTVSFDYIDTLEYTIAPLVTGIKAETGLIVDTPVVSDSGNSKIVIKGARDDMKKISRVVAVIDSNETLASSKSYEAQIKILDENGSELDIDKFTLPQSFSTKTVKITVPICKKKELPIVAAFNNTPEGLNNGLPYELSTYYATVIGPADTVDSMTEIKLSAIDFNEISTDNHKFKDVSFALPDGVRILDNIASVDVTVNISGYLSKSFDVLQSNIVFNNVGMGITASANAGIKNARLCGARSVINSLKQSDIYAEVDMSGKSAGDYNVEAKIYCPSQNGVWQVGTYNIAVTLK